MRLLSVPIIVLHLSDEHLVHRVLGCSLLDVLVVDRQASFMFHFVHRCNDGDLDLVSEVLVCGVGGEPQEWVP